MLLNKRIIHQAAITTGFFFLLLVTLATETAWSAPCDVKPAAPDTIRHNMSISYCELCGYGYVTIIISNGYEGVDMTNMTLVENLAGSGLTYYLPNPTDPPVTYQVNSGPVLTGSAPTVSGADDEILTWTQSEIPALASLVYNSNPFNINTLTITFAVAHHDPLTQEDLIGATRLIQADLEYNIVGCSPVTNTATTGMNLLPLEEPNPVVSKQGRNVDAGQDDDHYSDDVYGNIYDDVIYRIHVTNNGSADLQDLRFDDVMGTDNIKINYICPTEDSASAVAANNGLDPGGTGCSAVLNNEVSDYDVDYPFGNNPVGDVSDLIDVLQGQAADIFLVGKIPDSPNGSCQANTTNTVSNIQWGCESQSPAGGISVTSSGDTPGSASATMSTLSDNDPNITVQYMGINSSSQPAGTKGRVRIRIQNDTGGTLKNFYLTNELPTEYVMDSTFTPTISVSGGYGAYPGRINSIEWMNPGVDLANTDPEFRLYSTTTNNPYSDQVNMLRHGETATVTFGIILVRSDSYDRTADIDIREEDPSTGTDPDNDIQVTNNLSVDFVNFCDPLSTQNMSLSTMHNTSPEDLDIDISGSELVFILTGDPDQHLPLTVNLRNRGGHDAEDYYAYVSFGQTMDVITVPSGCSLTTNPPAHREWQKPAPIPQLPALPAVYQCSSGTIGPGVRRQYTFEVVKSTDPVDIAADDLTFRADVTGEITLNDGTPLGFPASIARSDGITDPANTYSVDGIRARVVGFNLLKSQLGTCSEDPPPDTPDLLVQIGEECSFHIETGGWFGFQTPGFTYIAVQNIQVVDEMPEGQGYLHSEDSAPASTLAIDGVTLNPVTPPELYEGWIDWTFNSYPTYPRINTLDEWFRQNVRSRVLNGLTNSAPPNGHADLSTNTLNSYFQAVFAYTDPDTLLTEEQIFDLGPGTVGYPIADVRRISLTVTEPHITVVKEVCNESLYGVGPTCSEFHQLVDDGDAYNNYIYRIKVTNEQISDSVERAPAYDVTVTDKLDLSDYAYVIPFDSDGLDNDADSIIDGGDNEGSISDNTVKNETPGKITFSYNHSSGLERINPGQTVYLYYRVNYDDDAAPLQTFTNEAGATYDSLTGDFGNQSSPQRLNSDIGGARFYTSDKATARVRVLPVETQPKEILALSNTPLLAGPGTQEVVVGEEIRYQLSTLLPVALLRDFVIRDELPAGMGCAEALPVNLNAPPYDTAGFVPGGTFTPTCSGGVVEWHFGDQRVTNGTVANLYDFEINFIARVDNTAVNNETNVLSNGDPATVAMASYYNELNNLVTVNFGQVDVVVREPIIELTKAFAVAEADAADVLKVTVTATNTGTATAYNLRVLDDLTGTNMTYMGNVGGANPPDIIDTTTLGTNQPIFSWSAPNGIAVDDSVSFTFEVSADDIVQPHEILDNTIQADWTSLPGQTTALNAGGSIGSNGDPDGMRIGALPNAGDPVNDYETSTGAQLTVPAPTMEKTDLNPTAVPAIGEHKSFRIDIRLPEGVTENIRVSDNLNATGLSYVLENNATWDVTYTFQGIVTINGTAPDEAAFNAFPADSASGNVTWDIGTVVTQTEDDAAANAIDPLISIQYFARINNDLVTNNGENLQNGASVLYTHGETTADETLTDDTPLITVTEPLLTATKTVTNITNPGNPPEGGDVLEYVVAITNSGTSTAFDVNVVDTLPANLTYYSGFTPTAAIGGLPVAGFVSTPANTPIGPLVWGRDNADNSLDIPNGSSLVLTYRTVVTATGGDISNSAWVDWTSLDGTSNLERTGLGCPTTTEPNDYCTGPAVATVATVDTTSIDKTMSADTFETAPWSTATDSVVRVGDFVTYRLRLNLTGGLTQAIVVRDQLPGGMEFVSTISINGDTTPDYTAPASGPGSNFSYAPITSAAVPAAGQTGTLTWTIGDVNNDPFGDPTTDTIEIFYLASIQPDAGISHVASTSLTNNVVMDYATATGPAAPKTDSVSLTLVQPVLAVAKTAVAGGGDAVLAADELVTYTIDITNGGDGPAYDINLTDIIPIGMRNGAATITMVSMELVSGTALSIPTPAYDAATGLTTWELDTGVADQYTIPAGDTLRIVYQIQTDTDLGAGMNMINQAQVQQYHSLDDEAIPIRGGVSGEAQIYGPSNVASVTFTTDTPDALIKENPDQTSAAIGELFSYRITVPGTPQSTTLHDVRIIDDLSASAADMTFVSVTKISGSQPWTPVNTGTASNVVIEDTTVGIDIPAGEQIVIEITVMLDDTPTNVSGLLFHNTAGYTYNQISGDPATRMPGGDDTTPDLTIVSADTLEFEKSGPGIVQMAASATYTLDFHNTSTGTIWNPTLTDQIPNTENGGMCGAGPSNVRAQIFLADGVTEASPVLTEGSDYEVVFNGDPACEWTFNLLSPAGGVPADHRLIVTYDLTLDPDTENGISLTNIAGVTRWYSADPDVPGAAPRTYTRTLTDGTPGTVDHEDAHTITTETPVLQFEMSVVNAATGQDPGANASPGDVLRYTIEVTNSGPVGLSGISIVDELDALNTTPMFAAGSLNLITVPTGADTSASDASGGTSGTGLLNIGNLNLGADGDTDDTLVIIYEATLAPVITSGTVVLNQAELVSANPNQILSDDPNLGGETDPTETQITSAPQFQVLKTSTIMEGDPDILMAGEMLRYTLTVKNVGNENAENVYLRDNIPANTTYVANSTTLNGIAVPDPSDGVSPIQSGMLINTPENTTPGYMRADTDEAAANVATITFDVVVNPAAMDGLIIANQGFVGGDGAGSGTRPEQPSDDPDTEIPDDPTQNVVGNLPLLYAYKTVEIYQDFGSAGIVDPGDVLRYTISISNSGAIPATNVVLTDTVPPDTTYVEESLRLNDTTLVSDSGVLPLIDGLSVQSGDNPGDGIISAGQTAVVTFETTVNAGVPTGTIISNQGSVTSNELPAEPTDADGVASNGDQPTLIVVGAAQLLTITKEVGVVGSGAALAGGELEYVIRVSNVGSLPAIQVSVTDDLNPPLGEQVTYVDASGTLNGAAAGVDFTGGVLTADYAATYGDLQPGDTAVIRFRAQIDPGLALGTTITNTGLVSWNNPPQNGSASVSIDVGGTPGGATLNGNVWHDANLDKILDADTETRLEDWIVELYRNTTLVTTILTDANGAYVFSGLVPNQGSSDVYELRFLAPGAGPDTASLGITDSPFTNGPQRISAIVVSSGSNLQNLNLPLWPNGAVYNSVVRTAVQGARLTMLNGTTGQTLPEACFDDPVQQNQVTTANGFYKFDLNFSQSECQAGNDYIIEVTAPSAGYTPAPSAIIPPTSHAGTAPFSIPTCPNSVDDAVPGTTDFCEATTYATIPPVSVPPNTAGTVYYLHLVLDDSLVPGHSQVFNNPIPLDPELEGAVAITKTASLTNVTRSTLVPYTIRATNIFGVLLYDTDIVDQFPPGFKYMADSARLNGAAIEPRINGNELTWEDLDLQVNQVVTIQMLLVVGSGVSEGEYVNRAWVVNPAMETIISGEATATVRVIPDPDFDCTDVIGKVFDDHNLNGYQDEDEKGLADVRIATVKGLNVTTDEFGRYHITCAAIPDEDLGSNLLLKLDERTLPAGYRVTTENPRVQRATRGKMLRINFGAAIHRVVRMDITESVFEPDTCNIRPQWMPRITQLMEELKKAPSILRLSYLGDVEKESVVKDRLQALKQQIRSLWNEADKSYTLVIETELFWRRGGPEGGKR